jgi:predicted nucleotidyltransferase
MAELVFAFQDASWMADYYLDTETGQVLMITEEVRGELEALYEEARELDPGSRPDLAALVADSGLPDWEQEMVLEAGQVEAGLGRRYVAVPHADSGDGYDDMEAFIPTVRDQRLQDRLSRALQGRGPFRRFKDVLASYPDERERWFDLSNDRLEERVVDWLASKGIEPLLAEPAEALEEPGPPLRSQFLEEVLLFVQAASKLAGVTRIALIGSLATDKPKPQDVDMLVTVTDEADLAPLAALGRKLHGHCQSLGAGAEVFLADPRGTHLGRTCPWRQCEPGIRKSCDALHCGRRHYLHDDLQALRLPQDLVAAPPIELWPAIVARVPVPEDVERELLLPLRAWLAQGG